MTARTAKALSDLLQEGGRLIEQLPEEDVAEVSKLLLASESGPLATAVQAQVSQPVDGAHGPTLYRSEPAQIAEGLCRDALVEQVVLSAVAEVQTELQCARAQAYAGILPDTIEAQADDTETGSVMTARTAKALSDLLKEGGRLIEQLPADEVLEVSTALTCQHDEKNPLVAALQSRLAHHAHREISDKSSQMQTQTQTQTQMQKHSCSNSHSSNIQELLHRRQDALQKAKLSIEAARRLYTPDMVNPHHPAASSGHTTSTAPASEGMTSKHPEADALDIIQQANSRIRAALALLSKATGFRNPF